MSDSGKKKLYTFEEYLDLEEKAEYKSEFYQGRIVPLFSPKSELGKAESDELHNLIIANLVRNLRNALPDKGYLVFGKDTQIMIEEEDPFYSPDAMVICGPREYYEDRKDVVTNPTVVFEVLSESTAAWDYGGKFRRYQKLISLQEYVLIEQNEAQVIVFRRNQAGEWLVENYGGLDAVVELKSIEVLVSVKEIYQGIEF
jgi:Uma2 family endonuclease